MAAILLFTNSVRCQNNNGDASDNERQAPAEGSGSSPVIGLQADAIESIQGLISKASAENSAFPAQVSSVVSNAINTIGIEQNNNQATLSRQSANGESEDMTASAPVLEFSSGVESINSMISSSLLNSLDSNLSSKTAPEENEPQPSSSVPESGDSSSLVQQRWNAPCDTPGQSTCSAEGNGILYKCTDGYWEQIKCGSGTVCKMKTNTQAVCLDPKVSPVDLVVSNSTDSIIKSPCQVAGQSKCDSLNINAYFSCSEGFWQPQKCKGDNVCKLGKDGKVACIDKSLASIKVQPCPVNGATQCIKGGKASLYQKCVDKEWVQLTCDGNNVCGIKGNSVICYDPSKKLVDIVRDPCTFENEMRCYLPDESMYQSCINNNWTNMTCSNGNVCRNIVGKDQVGCFDPTISVVDGNDGIIIISSRQGTSNSNRLLNETSIVYLAYFIITIFITYH
ncbi:hypothetical protein AYI69_g7489 [Smittium culicis]|uniref:Carbohydrate-binding module family 19 domain-containing protein n=1 Tax=Smittium culicis TaxID=133412 RepID=A0A1R1XRM3_9FUNG|nr:hypothetical protein AYI69_g7489 [Smittium culicis]